MSTVTACIFQDKKAALVIHGYVDDIMEKLLEGLGLLIPKYDTKTFLSQVSIFGKQKVEDQKVESKYGVLDSHIGNKRLKLESNKTD